MKITPYSKKTNIALILASIGFSNSSLATPLNLVSYPAGTAYKAPIPNVILSVDTSGSMSTKDDGQNTRIQLVKDGLNSVLINSTKYDNQFRLAWQSFACNDIPSNSGNCLNLNSMGKFSTTQKTNFQTWVNALTATGATPSQVLAWNAGKYLKTTGNNNPWNANPGTADPSPLTCRRAYHIFLTDGGWNFTYGSSALNNTSFQTEMKLSSNSSSIEIQNYDGKDIQNLPTPAPASTNRSASIYGNQSYLSSNTQTNVYRDSYGLIVKSTGSKNNNNLQYYAYPTLSDIAFYYWANDLQTNIPNEVNPKIRKTGDETFTSSNNKSKTLSEYWNPKNDPAEWQHLVQYTIGYGATASTLSKIGGATSSTYNGKACSNYSGSNKTTCLNSSTSPQWSGGIFGMYDTGFSSLIVGNTKWDDVTSSESDSDYDDFRPQELWHMAINSRGKYYPVTGDLTSVFSDIFDDIIVDTNAPITGFTSASGSVSRVGTQSYQTSYIAADDPNSNDNRWYGFVTSDYISTSGASVMNPDWGTNPSNNKASSTADKLDTLNSTGVNNRLVLSFNNLSSTPQGISFKWSNLSSSTSNTTATQKMWMNKGTAGTAATVQGDGRGEDRVNFIRGDRSKESSNYSTSNTTANFRNRKSRQGDIVNSAIWYVGSPANGYTSNSYQAFINTNRDRLPMLYVGGNDGMLHGFSAKDGTEKIAYVPHGVVQNLASLTDTAYVHRYYVDGSPMSGDIDIGSTTPDWRTYLIGTLGAGGRGYFVLDVTKPGPTPPATGSTSVAPSTNFSENNAASLVIMDKTAAAITDAAGTSKPLDSNVDSDIGHILGSPVVSESNFQRTLQITKMNNGRWAFIAGNGYNSVNERPVLLIQYLDGDKSLLKIPAVATGAVEATQNGLSSPQLLDINADGSPDFVYAGDLRGNMWKFDISSATSSNWGVAFSGNPLFTANYTSSTGSSSRQPITAPPTLRNNRTVGGLMVAFGTGRNLTAEDRTDTSVQTVYSILDNSRYTISSSGSDKGKVIVKTSDPAPSTVSGRSALQNQSVTNGTGSGASGTGDSANRNYWTLSSQEVNYVCDATNSSCSVKKGWYLDLPVPGERVNSSFDFYDGSNLLEIISEKPASGSATASGEEVCAPQPQAAKTFRTIINISSGSSSSVPIIDINGDGLFNASDMSNGKNYSRMTASGKELRFNNRNFQIRKGNDGQTDKLARLPEVLVRPGWRQLK